MVYTVSKDKPLKTEYGDITYDQLRCATVNEFTGLYHVTGYVSFDGYNEFNPHLRIRLIDNDEYDHGNGD